MKNTLTPLLISLFCIQAAYGQFSIHLDGGYGFAPPNQEVGSFSDRTQGFNGFGYVFGSYGKGVQAGLRLGYHWNYLLGVELGAYFQQHELRSYSLNDTVFVQTVDRSTSQILLTPTLVFGRSDEGLRPFGRVGLVIPLNTSLTEDLYLENDFTNQGGTFNVSRREYEHEVSRNMGALASLGLRYRKGMLSITAEAYWQSLTLRPLSRTMASYTVNDEDFLEQIPTMLREQVFVDEIREDSNGFGLNTDPDQPGTQLVFALPYSTVGLRLGIGIMIGE